MAAGHESHGHCVIKPLSRRMAWSSATLDGYKATNRLNENLRLYQEVTVDPEEREYCQEIMNRIALDSFQNDGRTGGCMSLPEQLTPINPDYTEPGKCQKDHQYSMKDSDYFYLTTNKKEFQGTLGGPAVNARPRSSRFYPSKGKTESSHYATEYFGKKAEKRRPIQRIGSSSGQRKNKPHPGENFMIWKFPGKLPPLDNKFGDFNKGFMEQVSKEALKSTYQVDYTGLPQGTQVQIAVEGYYPNSKIERPPFTLDSTSRFEYQPPCLHHNLKNNTLRYGCNSRKGIPAIGAVPNVPPNAPIMQLHGRTHYSTEYSDKSEKADIKRYLRPQEATVLDKYLTSAKREDRENMANLIRSLAASDKEDYELKRVSNWSGPK